MGVSLFNGLYNVHILMCALSVPIMIAQAPLM